MNIYQLEGLGFWILPAGSPPRNPLEFMQSGKLSLLMDQLAGWFDWIVIDSPPVLPLADTSVWMRLADGGPPRDTARKNCKTAAATSPGSGGAARSCLAHCSMVPGRRL